MVGGLLFGIFALIPLVQAQEESQKGASCEWEVRPIERLSAQELGSLTVAEFFRRFEDHPVIVTGLDLAAPLWSPRDIATECPGTFMPTMVPTRHANDEDNADDSRHPDENWSNWAGLEDGPEVSIEDFVEHIENDLQSTAGKKKLHYGFDYNVGKQCPTLRAKLVAPPLASDCLLQRYFVPNRQRQYEWPSLMMGPKGSRSEMHNDDGGLAFWMAVHHGRKHWRVLPHGENNHLTEFDPNKFIPPATGKQPSGVVLQSLQMSGREEYAFKGFAPDFRTFPELCEAIVYDGEVGAGELIYVPNGALHGAMNLETTVATVTNFFHPADARQTVWLKQYICSASSHAQEFVGEDSNACDNMILQIDTDRESGKWDSITMATIIASSSSSSASSCAADTSFPPPSSPEEHLDSWVRDSPIPTEPIQGWPDWDLADLKVYELDNVLSGPRQLMSWARPPRKFDSRPEREELHLVIAKLLRKALERTRQAAAAQLAVAAPEDVDILLSSTRALFDSIEDFYHQAASAINLGWSQIDPTQGDYNEYGPETNFWLKFRPYLHCKHTPRLGPETGGQKAWCNPEYLQEVVKPRFLMSAGSGDDFSYEDFVLEAFPNLNAFVADCFSQHDGNARDGRMHYIPQCLHGDDPGDAGWMKEKDKFVSLPEMAAGLRDRFGDSLGFENFDLIKANIEAYEYPLFGYAMKDPDEHMKHTVQIHLEMHRLGMADGCTWSSLMFGELLFATFMSAGFHPVFTEKWHDSSAAQDVVFVNATFYLQSELYMVREAWKKPRSARQLSPQIPPLHANIISTEFDGYTHAAVRHPHEDDDVSVSFFIPEEYNVVHMYWVNVEDFTFHLKDEEALQNHDTHDGHLFVFLFPEAKTIEAVMIDKSIEEYVVGPLTTEVAIDAIMEEGRLEEFDAQLDEISWNLPTYKQRNDDANASRNPL
jgi:hypothetical protein